MRSRVIFGATCLVVLLFWAGACSNKSTPTGPDTTAPTVALTVSDTAVTAGGPITLTATASDNVGVTAVEFDDGATVLDTVTASPFQLQVDLDTTDNGDHLYTAVARDAAGNSATSPAKKVAVAIPSLPVLDEFTDGEIDSTQWLAQAHGGPSVAEINGRLELTVPTTITDPTSTAGLTSVCTLVGDFDIEVDYVLLEWPAQSGVRSALGCSRGAAERNSFAAGEFNSQESYASDFQAAGGGIKLFPTTDTSGTFRMTRSGDKLEAYYWNGLDWQPMDSVTVSSGEELTPALAVWTAPNIFSGQEVRMAFDHFRIVSGTVGSCP